MLRAGTAVEARRPGRREAWRPARVLRDAGVGAEVSVQFHGSVEEVVLKWGHVKRAAEFAWKTTRRGRACADFVDLTAEPAEQPAVQRDGGDVLVILDDGEEEEEEEEEVVVVVPSAVPAKRALERDRRGSSVEERVLAPAPAKRPRAIGANGLSVLEPSVAGMARGDAQQGGARRFHEQVADAAREETDGGVNIPSSSIPNPKHVWDLSAKRPPPSFGRVPRMEPNGREENTSVHRGNLGVETYGIPKRPPDTKAKKASELPGHRAPSRHPRTSVGSVPIPRALPQKGDTRGPWVRGLRAVNGVQDACMSSGRPRSPSRPECGDVDQQDDVNTGGTNMGYERHPQASFLFDAPIPRNPRKSLKSRTSARKQPSNLPRAKLSGIFRKRTGDSQRRRPMIMRHSPPAAKLAASRKFRVPANELDALTNAEPPSDEEDMPLSTVQSRTRDDMTLAETNSSTEEDELLASVQDRVLKQQRLRRELGFSSLKAGATYDRTMSGEVVIATGGEVRAEYETAPAALDDSLNVSAEISSEDPAPATSTDAEGSPAFPEDADDSDLRHENRLTKRTYEDKVDSVIPDIGSLSLASLPVRRVRHGKSKPKRWDGAKAVVAVASVGQQVESMAGSSPEVYLSDHSIQGPGLGEYDALRVYSCTCKWSKSRTKHTGREVGAVQCSLCGLWSHLQCVDLSKGQISALQREDYTKRPRFICFACTENLEEQGCGSDIDQRRTCIALRKWPPFQDEIEYSAYTQCDLKRTAPKKANFDTRLKDRRQPPRPALSLAEIELREANVESCLCGTRPFSEERGLDCVVTTVLANGKYS